MRNKDLTEIITGLKEKYSLTNENIGQMFVNAIYSLPNNLFYETSSDIPSRNRKKAVIEHLRTHLSEPKNALNNPTQAYSKINFPNPSLLKLEYLTMKLHTHGASMEVIGSKIISGAEEYHESKPDEIKSSGRNYKLFTEYNCLAKHLEEISRM